MPSKPVRQLLAAVTVFVVVGAGVAALLLFGGDDRPSPPATLPTAPAPTTQASPPAPRDRVLAVKIDNVRAARPQTGLAAADVVYVEPVEAGLTRLVAVYSSRLPGIAGPVRSARQSDIELLAQYGRSTLAYSGAAPEIRSLLRRSPMHLVTEQRRPGAFFREPARPRPHNLYVRPGRLPKGTGPGPRHVLDFGIAPAGGRPTVQHTVNYRAASYRFDWSKRDGRWLVSVDGGPLESVGAGRVGAPTIVVQHVALRQGRGVRDSTGAPSPVVRTVGKGKATVLRGGRAYSGTWSRPKASEGTTFTTASGDPLRLAKGPVWILLVPKGS